MYPTQPSRRISRQPANASSIGDGKSLKPARAEPRSNLPSSNVRGFTNEDSRVASWVNRVEENSLIDRDLPSDTRSQSQKPMSPLSRPSNQSSKLANQNAWSNIVAGAEASSNDQRLPGRNEGKAPVTRINPPGYSRLEQSHSASGKDANQPAVSRFPATNLPPHLRAASSIISSNGTSPISHLRGGSSVISSKVSEHAASNGNRAASVNFKHLPEAQIDAVSTPKANNTRNLDMNAGKAAKSAKLDSNFPCTYKDCTRGFAKEKSMKAHKDEDHDWCRDCNLDFEDNDAFIQHKIENEDKHICCRICGTDFQSEGGRNRHEKQHGTQQRVECRGCGIIFEKGAALIDHIYMNKCKDRQGRLQDKLNHEKIREARAQAALHMNEVAQKNMKEGEKPEDFDSFQGSVSNDTAGGGVPVPNYMDDDVPSTVGDVALSSAAEGSDESTATSVPAVKAVTPAVDHWPTVAEVAGQSKKPKDPIIKGLDDLHVTAPKSQSTAKSLFPNAKPTPVVGGWSQPSSSRRPSIAPLDRPMGTDWDHEKFEPSAIDGRYHCPFKNCT